MDELDQKLRPIANIIANGDAVLFVGNGLSMSVGAPSWDKLIAPLKEELDPPTSETDPCRIAQYYRNQFGDHSFYARIREILQGSDLAPGPAHAALVALPVNAILTTNYDNLLERALDQAKKKCHVISDNAEVAVWSDREVQLLKLHGDLDSVSTMVLSQEDYDRFPSKNVLIQRKLVDLLSSRHVIFIGSSLRDSDIQFVQHEIMDAAGRLSRKAYNLTFEKDVHRHREWQRQSIEPVQIEQTPGEDGDALVHVLNRLNNLVREARGECDVLLVDDDANWATYLRGIIEGFVPGVRVAVETNGYSAAAKVGTLRPKIALIDVCLDGPESIEGLNGFKLVEVLRSQKAFRPIDIIMFSGYADVSPVPGTGISIADMAAAAKLEFIEKSDPTQLVAAIKRRLSQLVAA